MASARGFASDNTSGIHPEVLAAIAAANQGHAASYGGDQLTEKAQAVFKKHFGSQSEAYFLFTGTAANVLSLAAMTQPFDAVICPKTAHLNEHECGAPEKFTGCKLITIETENGKITVEQVKKQMCGVGNPHYVQPRVISITQPTECGTLYSPKEVRQLSDFAHQNNMLLHMDGARLSNAAASIGIGLKEASADLGVDVLSFGGTKNGMMTGESVVFFKPELAKNFHYIRKQGMQLDSKMRFISAQFIAFLENGLWLRNASHSNKMARLLADELGKIPQVKITQEVQANMVFAILPKKCILPLQKAYAFGFWDEPKNEVRLVASFDTTEEDIHGFVKALKEAL